MYVEGKVYSVKTQEAEVDPMVVVKNLLNKIFADHKIGAGYFSPDLQTRPDDPNQLCREVEQYTSHSWYTTVDVGEPLTEDQLEIFRWARQTYGRLAEAASTLK